MSFDKEFWEYYYKSRKEVIEWYDTYDAFKPILEKVIPNRPVDALLHIGCGSSVLGNQLKKDNFAKKVVNMDFSPLVIEYMKKNHSEPDVVYEEGDVTSLIYPTESFDVVFDKGLIDSILSSDGTMDLMKIFFEVNRVMKPNGLFLVITPKEDREYYFRRFGWTYDRYEFQRKQDYNISRSPDNTYYLFVVKRNGLRPTA
eukprot:TRINITY_DN1447_c0_g1_i1.p1 TRINITY_DN1447_c0_g1~~TRINITY_DN1447_c0_g1_i1.p1  ORF type:complete len:200 (+),score=21.88 TRINITY_DN1447_c0_g1_i1:109-708(+)